MPGTRCKTASRCAITLLAIAALAACGGDQAGSTLSPSPATGASPSHSASPSPKTFSFRLNPVDTSKATGTITLSAGQRSITVELRITGLPASSSHISHIHIGSCQSRGGIAFALNQVIADGQGIADVRTTFPATYPPTSGRWYVVVHAGPDMQGSSALYLMCGNLF